MLLLGASGSGKSALLRALAGVLGDDEGESEGRLTVDGRIVATALGLAHNDAFLVILSGFTQTEFKNQSLGSLLFEQIARDCIAHGEAVLDFTIGDEPYKRTFGAQPSPMWQMSRAGSALGLVASTLVERLPSAKALARNLFLRSESRMRGAQVL